MKEEGVYNIKRVDKLPNRGNANLLYSIKNEDEMKHLYRWKSDGTYEIIAVGAVGGGLQSVQAGTNVTIDDTDPLNPIISSIGVESAFETINEGNGNGIAKVGRTAANYGNLGLRAFDASASTGASTKRGSLAQDSQTFGRDNENNFPTSLMFGQDNSDVQSGTSFVAANILGGGEQDFGNNIIGCVVGGERSTISAPGYSLTTGVLFNSLHVGGKNEFLRGHGSGMIGSFLISSAGQCLTVGIANVDETLTNATNISGASVDEDNPRLVVGCGLVNTYTAGGISQRRTGFKVMGDGGVYTDTMDNTFIEDSANTRVVIHREFLESRVRKAIINLSAAQLATANTIPVELLPAPGVGRVIRLDVFKSTGILNYGTTTYNFGANINIVYTTSGNIICRVETSSINNTSDSIDAVSAVGTGHVMSENQSITLLAAANPSTGDGTYRLILYYTIEETGL